MTRILVAQINTTVGDFKGNTELLLGALTKAKKQNCSLVITSELYLSGYPPNDLLFFPHFLEENEQAIKTITKECQGITLILGCLRKNKGDGKPLFNSALVIEDQKILHTYDKCLLPTYDVFDERRYFEPGKNPLVFDHLGKKIAITICEDIWEEKMDSLYPQNPLDLLSSKNPDLLVNLSASPFELGKETQRYKLGKQASKKLKCPFIYCNQVGANDTLIFDGSSFVCDSSKLFKKAKNFEEELMFVDTGEQDPQILEKRPLEEELYQALVLGIRDFFKKQNFQKAVIGLSGGIDSALVTTLATEALGKKHVLAIALPSCYSSQSSVEDARELAQNLEISFKEVSIESIHAPLLELLDSDFKNLPKDVTEENLQARIRGIILMAYSNKLNHLLLSCGNKSEMAMGYATLYGDLAGGLAAISDLTKSQVYALSKWINRDHEIIPHSILTKAPTAELRPNQKDSDTLPDYALLDQIIEGYVQKGLTPKKIANQLNLDIHFVNSLIKKIHAAEYKRRQSPLGLRVTSKAFSAGWKFPIVQRWTH